MTLRSGSDTGRDVLHREEAAQRARRVRDVRYELSFELDAGRQTYSGRAVIGFALDSPDEALFIDFTGRPTSLLVNGSSLLPDHRDHRLHLPAAALEAQNRIIVDYENRYDATGDGFHHFVDPEDGSEYLYSNLEPFSAHRLFPCFDQPDLKATYRLSVVAPRDWQVISAEQVVRNVGTPDGRTRHEFATTPRFSPYLFVLIAGPYERIAGAHDGLSLGVLGRRSMHRELERSVDEILEVTGQGLDHFRELFGQPFPFTKYDQIFVPEFNAGAMENVAAVTFNDGYLFRDPPTYGQRLARGEVVLHELAHMWFGNLVTMSWWDDLWLNETFATYLSYRCLADATRFTDAWQAFNGQLRPAAYRQDQLVTTHPIATDVEHTDQAVGNFDAITYEKGAAVIKQLVATIGDDAFKAGLQTYFARFAWGNASLADFLGALGGAAGRSLDDWAARWLQTPSLNTIGVRWSTSDGEIDEMVLWQTAPDEFPTLRAHRTSVGLVSEGPAGEGLSVTSIPALIDSTEQPVPDAIGRPAPVFVYPNHGDHDYALGSLDDVSVEFALERLPDLPGSLLRQQVWSTLWEMVRDGRLRTTDYLAAVRRFATQESDRSLVQSIVDRAEIALRRFVPEGELAAESAAMTSTAVAALRATQHEDLRLLWARAATAMASRPPDIEGLLDLVDGGWSVDGFEPDQEMRWLLATKAAAHDIEAAQARLDAEEARDRSDRGQRAAIRARVARPDVESKREAWDRINGAGYGSDYLTRAAMMGFQWRHQRELLLPYRASFYERVRDIFETRDHAFAEGYVRWLVPDLWAEPAELERIRTCCSDLSAQDGLLRRRLSEIADDMERDIRVRALVAAAPVF